MDSALRDWRVTSGIAGLLALHVALALWAVSGKSVTADEILHVTGGYLYNRYGDYRIHPENGNLPQRLAGLPAWWNSAPPPPFAGNDYWRVSDAGVIGHQFFYETGHDHWPMLMAARTLMLVFSVGTGLLVFGWSRRLFGRAAGFFALALYALDPNILAHAPLATSDSAAVFFLLASVTAFWAHLQNPHWRNGALSAFTFGLACVAKYSAVLLLPVFVVLWAWRIWREPAEGRAGWWRRGPLILAIHGAAAWLIIWASFGFRYSGVAPALPEAAHYILPWDQVLPYLGWQGRVIDFCRGWRVLPEAFLYGYSWVMFSAQARGAFLAGDYSIHGWVSFFPLAFWWKTTLALLAALLLGVWALARRWVYAAGKWRNDITRVAPLLTLFVVYGAFSLASHLNIGHRHILPVYPVLFILVGGLAAPGVLSQAWRRWTALLILGATLVANARVAPHYLAFFNTLAGGPANGWRLLVDSSLDWGQDLSGLRTWLKQHNPRPNPQPVFLSYFGSGDPAYYQINATWLPFVNGFKYIHPWYEMRGGLYCVSATMLQQVYSPVRGEWTVALEAEYQQLRHLEHVFRNVPGRLASDGRSPVVAYVQDERIWQRYDVLRFARLCHYLRARRPDAMIGYSILIFRLTPAEVDAAVNLPYRDWLAAIAAAPR